MAAPHAIHEEFPDQAEAIHRLKLENAHFARLLEDYDSVNDEVAAAESLVQPTTQEHETDLRKRRARLKDEIAQMLGSVHGAAR